MAGTIVDSVTLNFTDLTGAKTGCTSLGSNKFWKGWVEDIGGGMGNFECKWGPTGEPGSDKGSQRGIPICSARDQLAKKVKEKVAKGYTRLDTRSDQEEMAKAAAKGVLVAPDPAPKAVAKTTAASRIFHPEVGRLLGIIYGETSRVVRAGLSAQAGATAENPIGNLSDRQLDLGGSILDEIETFITKALGRECSTNRSQTIPLIRGVPDSKIIDFTDRFMSNVPRQIGRDQRGRENLHQIVISSFERLDEQRKFLQLLRDAHLTKDVFQAASHVTTSGGKEEVWYDGLGCDIDICEPGSAEYRKVVDIFNNGQSRNNANWWRNGQSTLQVVRVFKFIRKGADARFQAYSNRMAAKPGAVGNIMAWHGTRTENLLGISKVGLLMPENLPRGVHISGKAFGKGIYHAPCTTGIKTICGFPTDGTNGALKSMNYTSAQGAYYGSGNTSRSAFMYLQDVALGIADVRTSACWDKARPDDWPRKDFIYACATKNSGGFTHDEMVTFDQDAQTFRYLLEIETR